MNTEGLVNEVIALLNAALTAPKIISKPWSSDPKEKPAVLGGVAEIWVAYDGSQFKDPSAIDGVTQDRTRRLAVALFAKKLNGNRGAAALIDAIQEVVHGHRPSDGGPLLCMSDSYVGFDNGVWQYSLIFRTTSPKIALETPSGLGNTVMGPALRRVTLDDDVGGDTELELS
jgi:hypothetical protein